MCDISGIPIVPGPAFLRSTCSPYREERVLIRAENAAGRIQPTRTTYYSPHKLGSEQLRFVQD
eukprot:scaffold16208_cov73-Cylindrotheca_fusiformis.AAC.1